MLTATIAEAVGTKLAVTYRTKETLAMKTGVVTAALVVALATPALAGSGAYYIGLRLGSVSCTIMTHEPSPEKYKMMDKYMTRADARKALTEMPECH